MKPTMFDPEGSYALAELLLDQLSDVKADYVGGLALGAVPLISTLTMLSHQTGRPVSGFFVRKEVKDHGTKKLVEGLRKDESLQGQEGRDHRRCHDHRRLFDDRGRCGARVRRRGHSRSFGRGPGAGRRGNLRQARTFPFRAVFSAQRFPEIINLAHSIKKRPPVGGRFLLLVIRREDAASRHRKNLVAPARAIVPATASRSLAIQESSAGPAARKKPLVPWSRRKRRPEGPLLRLRVPEGRPDRSR